MKRLLVISITIYLIGCSNLGNVGYDVEQCNNLAYGEHNDKLYDSENIYQQCLTDKKQQRKQVNKDADIDATADFIFDLLDIFIHDGE